MIRRLPVTVAALALTSILASGCTATGTDNSAIKVGDKSLTADEVAGMAKGFSLLSTDPQYTADENDELAGDTVRFMITRWVVVTAMREGMEAAGVDFGDAATAKATADARAGSPEVDTNWDNFDPVTQRFLIDYQIAGQALSSAESPLTPDLISGLYKQGPDASPLVCLRVIITPDAAGRDAVEQQLADGAAFADVADATNTGGTFGDGGELTDPDTGSPCVISAAIPPEVLRGLSGIAAGTATGPIEFDGQYVFAMPRPYDEIAEGLATTITAKGAAVATVYYVREADIDVDSRYGMWDNESASVIPIT